MIRRSNVETAILCDDIRQEISNKLILVGVYSADVVVQHMPLVLALSVYLSLRGLSPGTHEFNLRLRAGNEVGLTGKVAVASPDEQVVLATPRLPLQVAQPGPIVCELKIGKSDWFEVIRKEVTAGQVPTPFPFAQGEESQSSEAQGVPTS